MSQPVVVVGAGLAGLVCARRLHQVGVPILLLEQDSRPGGRIKTDEVEGFRLDRGFQVYFSKYPHAMLELDYKRLDLRRYEPACLVLDGKRFHEIERDNAIGMAFNSYLSLPDKARILQWTNEVCSMSEREIWAMDEQPAREYLLQRGFSPQFMDRFIVPFFSGVLLDRSLDVSIRPLAFYWKMLGQRTGLGFDNPEPAETVIPALGMEEITKQIAADLPPACFRFGVRVTGLATGGGRVAGVELAGGETIRAETVVVATDAEAATRLTGIQTVRGGRSCTSIHYAVSDRPLDRPILAVTKEAKHLMNHVAVVSNVSRGLAPAGQHLVTATCLGSPGDSDISLAKSVQFELASWFQKDTSGWRPLRVDRIVNAQMTMRVGDLERLPGNKTPTEGLYLAGDYTAYAGIDGAAKSGQQCASAVLAARMEPAGK